MEERFHRYLRDLEEHKVLTEEADHTTEERMASEEIAASKEEIEELINHRRYLDDQYRKGLDEWENDKRRAEDMVSQAEDMTKEHAMFYISIFVLIVALTLAIWIDYRVAIGSGVVAIIFVIISWHKRHKASECLIERKNRLQEIIATTPLSIENIRKQLNEIAPAEELQAHMQESMLASQRREMLREQEEKRVTENIKRKAEIDKAREALLAYYRRFALITELDVQSVGQMKQH